MVGLRPFLTLNETETETQFRFRSCMKLPSPGLTLSTSKTILSFGLGFVLPVLTINETQNETENETKHQFKTKNSFNSPKHQLNNSINTKSPHMSNHCYISHNQYSITIVIML